MSFLKRNNVFLVILLILISLPSVFPLFGNGFIRTDDADWMVIRFSAFYQALSDGQFPVRWLPRLNHSFGYPVANFLYPGFMYLGVPLKFIGFSFIDSVKIVIAMSMIGSSLFTFFWLAKVFSRFAAFVGAAIYLYLPYHLYDLYERGSVGELLALGVLPFILWQIERRSFVLSAIGIGFLMLSHNTLALLFFFIIIGYMALQSDFTKYFFWYLGVALIGIGLATFFWFPALYDLSRTVFFQTQVSHFREYFAQVSIVGLAVPFVMLSFVFLFLMKSVKEKKHGIAFFVLGIIALFFSTGLSTLFWEFLPISFIQFPFRMLSVVLISLAFLTAWVIHAISSEKRQYILAGIVFLLLFPSFLRLTNVTLHEVNDDIYATNEGTTTVQNEYMPKYVRLVPSERPDSFVFLNDEPLPIMLRPTTDVSFTVTTNKPSFLTYNQLYFPGWVATVDGENVAIEHEKTGGIIGFQVNQGQHVIHIVFRETLPRILSDIVSLISLVALFAVPVILVRTSYAKHTKIF